MMDESLKHVPCGYCICAKCADKDCYYNGGCDLHKELKCPQFAGDTQECSEFREAVNDAGKE